jgi:addiction module HigA family antidote
MTQAELAERMGRPKKTINEIIGGRAELTPETALQLERVLGVPASFWGNLERHYRDFVARQQENEQLAKYAEWPPLFPVREMINLGWMAHASNKIDQVRALLAFFGVSSTEQWDSRYKSELAAFRLAKSVAPNVYSLTAWLREGERCAHRIDCAPFDQARFRKALLEARALTAERDANKSIADLTRLLAPCGVAVVLIPELTGSRACGATRWLGPQKAMIQLSLRYKSNDQLWFSFFHEAAHVVLHGKKDVFVEIAGGRSGSAEREAEADRWAADRLIARLDLQRLIERRPLSREAITSFAKEVGIAPGIVVGRLQHDQEIPYSHFNDLKVRYRWVHEGD